MEIILGLAVIIGIGIFYYYNKNKTLDANHDGKVDLQDVKPAIQEVSKDAVEKVTNVVDTNNDGKVTTEDIKPVIKKVIMVLKKFTVYWTATARDDLIEIIKYVSSDNLNNAQEIFQKIKKHTIGLESLPERGRIVPELKFLEVL